MTAPEPAPCRRLAVVRGVLWGVLALVAVVGATAGGVAAAQEPASYQAETSQLQVGAPQRGYVTATFTLTVRNATFSCSQATPGGCEVETRVAVQPGSTPCADGSGTQVASPYLFDNGTASQTASFRPAAVGESRLCITIRHNNMIVGTAETTFFSDDVYPTADDRNCTDFATQRSAQSEYNRWRPGDPYRLDADNDGRACTANPCPCYYGADYPLPAEPAAAPAPAPQPAPVLTPAPAPVTTPEPAETTASCSSPEGVQSISFSATKYPHIRAHFLAAVRRGWPKVMVLNRPGAEERRARLLRDVPTKPGQDRDEYPAAVGRGRGPGLTRGSNPRGWKADVAYVPSSENRSHGSVLGAKLKRFCDGTRFRYVFY